MRRFRNYHHRIEIQSLSGTTTADTRGQTQKTFSTIEVVQAHVRQLRGEEGILTRQLHPTATHEVETHYTANLTNQSRLKFGTRYLHVLAADNLEERGRTLRVVCKEEL